MSPGQTRAYPLTLILLALSVLPVGRTGAQTTPNTPLRRLIIFKVDGLNAGSLFAAMQQRDEQSGKSKLSWFSHIFAEQGTVFENFYVRGISLSAPSWSMLDTGQHTVIRGNVEYDRFTGEVYDYLNFIPFYIGYARMRQVDMPGVEVLDRAGIPLVVDSFAYPQIWQSFQLFQRGVRFATLENTLKRNFSSKAIVAIIENGGALSLDTALADQIEDELEAGITGSQLLYLDLFTGDVDHEGHATNSPAARLAVLRKADAVAGRIWTAIQKSPFAAQTLFVVVSDHGMNNVPGFTSETYSLPDLFNSPEGGAHHVLTNRQQLSDFKLKALNPLVNRVITPSNSSFYLKGQASAYPTAWLDIDGNERAAVHLRNSDLNKIQILFGELAKADLAPALRRAEAASLKSVIDKHRARWEDLLKNFGAELAALDQAIAARKEQVDGLPKKPTAAERESGEDKAYRRLAAELEDWRHERLAYSAYLDHVKALLAWEPDPAHRFSGKITDLVPAGALGDNNTVEELQHYVAGPAAHGMLLDAQGALDEAASFRYVDYFPLLVAQRVRNNPQPGLPSKPIDFVAMRLPDGRYAPDTPALQHAYWFYGDANSQLVVLEDGDRLTLRPVYHLAGDPSGTVHWMDQPWRSGLPLQLFEDPDLHLAAGADRERWLCAWHSEREWLDATHMCRYSNAVIGITEELSPVSEAVRLRPDESALLWRYEQRRRELVQADFHVFAADHWNFNVRFPNPGGNHGGFFRISTHSVWMMAGAGVPQQVIEEPYDSLNFASTLLQLLGKTPPMPDRVVNVSEMATARKH